MPAQGSEPSPIPCARCGAPMQEFGPTSLVGPVQVRCPYCHAVETLPAHEAQRVIALRARLAGLRAAQEAEEGPSVAYAKMVETLRSQIWIYAAIGIFSLVSLVGSTINQIRTAITATNISETVRKEILSSTATSSIGVGILFGVVIGYLLALRNYKKAVVPTLRARPPVQPGMPARCRSCGASLPADPTQGAFVQCAHCAAQNLISSDLMRDRVRLLDEETRAYSARAAGVQTKASHATGKFQTYFFIGGGIGLFFAVVLLVSMQFLIEALFFNTTAGTSFQASRLRYAQTSSVVSCPRGRGAPSCPFHGQFTPPKSRSRGFS